MLARDDENFSSGENELISDDTELEEPLERGVEGAYAPDPRDTEQTDQAYIEILESIKFDSTELVVSAVHNNP